MSNPNGPSNGTNGRQPNATNNPKIARIMELINMCQNEVNEQNLIINSMMERGDRAVKLNPQLAKLDMLERALNEKKNKLKSEQEKVDAILLKEQIKSKKPTTVSIPRPILKRVNFKDKNIVRWILVRELGGGRYDFKKSIKCGITSWIGEWIKSKNNKLVGSRLYKNITDNKGLKGGAYTFYELSTKASVGNAMYYRSEDELSSNSAVSNAVSSLKLNSKINFPVIIKFGPQAISLTDLTRITKVLNNSERANPTLMNNITSIKTYGDASLIELLKLINRKEYFYVRPVTRKVAGLITDLFNHGGSITQFSKYKVLLDTINREVGIIAYDKAIGLTLDRLVVLHFLIEQTVPDGSILVYYSTRDNTYTPFIKGTDSIPDDFPKITLQNFKKFNKEHDFLGSRVLKENKNMMRNVLNLISKRIPVVNTTEFSNKTIPPKINILPSYIHYRAIEDAVSAIIEIKKGLRQYVDAQTFVNKYKDYAILYDSGNIPEELRDKIVITLRHFANAANPPTPLYLINLPN